MKPTDFEVLSDRWLADAQSCVCWAVVGIFFVSCEDNLLYVVLVFLMTPDDCHEADQLAAEEPASFLVIARDGPSGQSSVLE